MSRKINFKLIFTSLSAKTNQETPFFCWKVFATSNIYQHKCEKTAKKVKNGRFSAITRQDLILHVNVKCKSYR